MSANENCIFLVDDDELYLKALENYLVRQYSREIQKKNISFKTFTSGEHCIKNMDSNPSVVIVDYYFSSKKTGLSGMRLMEKLKEENPDTYIIVLSGQENLEIAVNCLKYGAYDYIIKNESAFIRIQHLINNAIYTIELKKEMKTFERWNVLVASVFILIIVMGVLRYVNS